MSVSNTIDIVDDMGFDSLLPALRRHIERLSQIGGMLRWGSRTFLSERYIGALDQFHERLERSGELSYALEPLWRIERAASGALLTGYFEPCIRGSREMRRGFTRPFYRMPAQDDLQRLARDEIDSNGKLNGRDLELCWADPFDVFLVQVQGSGTVQFDDGGELHLNFAGKNGHPYISLGRLVEPIVGGPITLDVLTNFLRNLPPFEMQDWLNRNPSYVFFRESKQRARTTIGVPAEPGRTIATDTTAFFRGGVGILRFQCPSAAGDNRPVEYTPVTRFVLDQDSGGAIVGSDRIDLFMGAGDAAREVAGVMRHRADLSYLVPR